MELSSDCSFGDLRHEGQVGDWSEIGHVFSVESRLLEHWNDDRMLLTVLQSALTQCAHVSHVVHGLFWLHLKTADLARLICIGLQDMGLNLSKVI